MRPHEGHVQLCFNSQWNKICGEMFNRVEANVICKHLGYPGSENKSQYICILITNSIITIIICVCTGTQKCTNSCSQTEHYVEVSPQACKGHESAITECNPKQIKGNTCKNKYYWVNCLPGKLLATQ